MFVVLFLSLVILCASNQRSFEEKNAEFQHLVVDRKSGHVFIGALNKIYELSEDLAIEKWIPTGPLNKTGDKLTDNVNKVLILDDSGRLITCGSALGICSSRNLSNIYIGCDVPVTVVSNEEKDSTVAFLAAGPLNSNRSTRILYLASEVRDNNDIPTISGRLLDNRHDFEIAKVLSTQTETNQVKGTNIHNSFLYAKDKNVKYVYGFSSGIFSYFLKTQKKEDGDYHSVIARVCQDDDNYYNSYTEIPITCKSTDNTSYNLVQTGYVQKAAGILAQSLEISSSDDVLYASFCPNKEKSSLLEKSVLCVFSLQNIRKKFAENIKHCFNGEGIKGIGLKKPEPCLKTDSQIDSEDVCGLGVNVPLDGRIPVEGNAMILFADKVSALIVTNVRDHSVIIAGTETGHLKQVIAVNATLGVEYRDIVVLKSQSIMRDLTFSDNDEYLYALTKHKVFKIPIQECSNYNSYTECFQDVYCGWCSPKQKCTIESDCTYAQYKDPLFWISSDSKYQAVVTDVNPNNIFITSETLLTVKIENVVGLKDEIFCNFVLDSISHVTNGKKSEKGTQCKTPVFNSSKTYSRGPDPIPIKLLFQNSLTEPAFAATLVNFLDCNTYSSCTECIDKPDCNWCLIANRCTRYVNEECTQDSSIRSDKNESQDFCPSIISTNDQEKYVHSGETVGVYMRVRLVGFFLVQSRFICRFHVENGKTTTANARLLGDTLYCDRVKFEYTSSAPETTVSVDVIWGGSKQLDNPGKKHLVLYKCDRMANNLDACNKVAKQYNCKWCAKTNNCQFQGFC